MRVKLIANGSCPWERWTRRWGLSFVINDNILFDAFGDARVLMVNLHRFKVDIGKIEKVVVSHEHWDHVDGLKPFLTEKSGVGVYIPVKADAGVKTKIRLWGGSVIDVAGPVKIKEEVHLSGEIIGKYDGKNIPEQALVLETSKGLVVIAGCAHPGIADMVCRIKKDFGKNVSGVIGGFHLKERLLEDIGMEAARLKTAGVQMAVPLHCTGSKASKIFQQVFGPGCLLLQEGQEISF